MDFSSRYQGLQNSCGVLHCIRKSYAKTGETAPQRMKSEVDYCNIDCRSPTENFKMQNETRSDT